jgi:predicted CopG family antitoxin
MKWKSIKLDVLNIGEITSLNNNILSDRTNHYLKLLLFNMRVMFRYNDNNLDDLAEFYEYIEAILSNNIEVDDEELKILIYRITDLIVNIEDYDVTGDTIITETISYLLSSLYLELETYRLVDLYNRDDEFSDVIAGQIKNQVVEFDLLVKILDTSNEKEVKGIVLEILENNYPFEYARYKARRQCLDY